MGESSSRIIFDFKEVEDKIEAEVESINREFNFALVFNFSSLTLIINKKNRKIFTILSDIV